jgi:hypothetical protein
MSLHVSGKRGSNADAKVGTGTGKAASRPSYEYLLINFISFSLFKFFSLLSRIIASPLLGFSIAHLSDHGKYGDVNLSEPLLCLFILSLISLV